MVLRSARPFSRFHALVPTMGVFAVIGSCALGCATDTDVEAEYSEDDLVSGKYVTDAVLDVLQKRHAAAQGTMWADTTDGRLDANWLFQIPAFSSWGESSIPGPAPCSGDACDPDFSLRRCTSSQECSHEDARGNVVAGRCVGLHATIAHEGDVPTSLCVGENDQVLDTYYDLMVSAETSVDITSLTGPDGRFEAMIRNALTRLSEKANPPTVRMLFGSYPGSYAAPQEILASLTRDVKAPYFPAVVGRYAVGPTTWNHSKILTVDGRKVFMGGMNLWNRPYLESNPVHDMNVLLSGSVARKTALFVDQLWAPICRAPETTAAYPGGTDSCLPSFEERVPAASFPAGRRMITLGRLGNKGTNPADDALVALVDSAKTRIRISQQDVAPFRRVGITLGEFPNNMYDAWIRAVRRNVDMQVVVSNEGAFAGDTASLASSYFNGFTIGEVWNKVNERAKETGIDATSALCRHLHMMYLRTSPESSWVGGGPQANHSKNILVDDRAFYVGSQNIYLSNLPEFGVLIADPTASAELLRNYWTPLLKYSAVTTYVDPICH